METDGTFSDNMMEADGNCNSNGYASAESADERDALGNTR